MHEWVFSLQEKDEKGELFVISSKKNIENLFRKLSKKFGSYRKLSRNIGIDECSLRRWRRNSQVSFSVLMKFEKEYQVEVEKIIKEIKYVTSKSSPNKIKIPELDPEIAYLVGYVSGDGHIRVPLKNRDHWEIIVESWTDESRLDYINEILKRKFNLTGIKTKNKTRPGYRLYINSKVVHKILTKVFEIPMGKKSDIIEVSKIIDKSNSKIKRKYLQGWFDAEGFVTFDKGNPRIEFYVKNRNITKWVKKELEINKIKVYKNKKGVLILRKSQINTFNSSIGFQHRKQLSKLSFSTVNGNNRATSSSRVYWA